MLRIVDVSLKNKEMNMRDMRDVYKNPVTQ